jgi:hypothetical protein
VGSGNAVGSRINLVDHLTIDIRHPDSTFAHGHAGTAQKTCCQPLDGDVCDRIVSKMNTDEPSWMPGWRALASVLVHLGRDDEACAVSARVREGVPGYRIRNTVNLMRPSPGLERYTDGLRRAGLPE